MAKIFSVVKIVEWISWHTVVVCHLNAGLRNPLVPQSNALHLFSEFRLFSYNCHENSFRGFKMSVVIMVEKRPSEEPKLEGECHTTLLAWKNNTWETDGNINSQWSSKLSYQYLHTSLCHSKKNWQTYSLENCWKRIWFWGFNCQKSKETLSFSALQMVVQNKI